MRKSRKLFVESLENRALLAGNVMVSVSGGDLIIRGDGSGNGVSVEQLDNGRYFVTGFSTSNNVNTTINGQANGRIVSGVTDDIDVSLGDGYDIFVMSNSAFRRQQLANQLSNNSAGAVPASPEAASSNVHAVTTRVQGNLLIGMGNGNDGVGFGARVGSRNGHGDVIKGSIIANVGSDDTVNGNDRVISDYSEAFDDMQFITGRGNDSVRVDHARVGDFLFADLGEGNDTFTSNEARGFHSQVYGRAGNDRIDVTNYFFEEEVFLNGGDGNNNIDANGLSGNHINITTGNGTDNVNVQKSRSFDDYIVNTGAGNDFVRLNNTDVDDVLSVFLLDGDDTLRISNSSAFHAHLDGGAGFDRFFNDGGNSTNSRKIVNFEA